MPKSPSGPVRRAQLIAPFGVGAMVMVPGGTSLIIGGLDYWYQTDHGVNNEVDLSEFKFQEWRLQALLRVGHFRLPPDYREPWRAGQNIPNAWLTMPALRFPAWHFCPDCHLLEERSPYERGHGGRIKCSECEQERKTRYMFQVPFIAMCEEGHLQDFPWREWVHRSSAPDCTKPLRLVSIGSATLAGQLVSCDCGVPPRNLAGITSSDNEGSYLSRNLDESGVVFNCRGNKPWLGPDITENCTAHLRGSLRSAANVYFAHTRSAIYLPPTENPAIQELMELMERPPLSTLIDMMRGLRAEPAGIAALARSQHTALLHNYSPEQITAAVEATIAAADKAEASDKSIEEFDEDARVSLRRAEFEVLRIERSEPHLKIRMEEFSEYGKEVTSFFSRLMLVDKLKETRAMAGFSRVFPETDLPVRELKHMLFRNSPQNLASAWLPAYIVYGEGIFFELDENRLQQWEEREDVHGRIALLAERYSDLRERRRLKERAVTPRFILLHTFAHLLINQLTFDCGYSSASLRERLYLASSPEAEMAGILIYTANGDSEGTMGGLVRMGKPGNIEPVLRKAVENAHWCSADPVCMEMGRFGQGPDSCNLAACHNCALVPETACEEFNRFLDRALVVGTHDDPSLGFFQLG
ncbi:MAG: DUF1998 domain-containing protein [Chloroflexi bacterium]|nr:DUF1998 domain-containing protein [Nitrososphaera sp.]MCI0727634.1 DUF1998 domain-containing protein [Chloroflexota bacterium]